MSTTGDAIEALIETPDPKVDKRLNALVVFALLVMVLLLVIGSVTMVKQWTSSEDTEAIRNSSRVTSCRALFSSRFIGDAETELLIAQAHLDAARADLDVAETDLLEAAAFGREAELAPIAERFNQLQQRATEEGRNVIQRAAVVDSGRAEYNALVQLSLDDPVEFLVQCEREG